MEIPYSFMQRSANNQFKDMAFFQILKRKGPYIERSLTKIQNDLFYRHKLPGSQMKNIAFIKQIRLTLSAYQILVNEIRNDFMMTELDSLGDSIHKMFSQMIIVLKKQKLAGDELRQISLEQKKKKEMVVKKLQDQYKAKQLQQVQKEKNDRFKQIQQLKYNFKQLFKLQIDSDKQRQAMQKVWVSIVADTVQKAKQSILIKDSQLQKIIKDSCQYMYKNHSQLDHIVRLTKQDITQAQKNIQSFGDQRQLLEENEQRIIQMKQVAKKLVNYVRDKVYDRTEVMVQTDLTQGDGSRGMMTTKELDEKRRMQLKMRALERQLKQKDNQISQMQLKLKQADLRLKQALQSSSQSQQQQNQHQLQYTNQRTSKRSHEIKKRTFINSRNNQSVKNNLIAQKFSANMLRNNNNNNKSRRQPVKNMGQQRLQQRQLMNNNSRQNSSSFKVNAKVSVRGSSNISDMRRGSIVLMTNNRKKMSDTIVVGNRSSNFNGNKNNIVNNNKPSRDSSNGLNPSSIKHGHALSQHEVLLNNQKNNGRLSQSTLKGSQGKIKNGYSINQRQSIYSEDKKRNSINVPFGVSQLQKKNVKGQKRQGQYEQRQSSLQQSQLSLQQQKDQIQPKIVNKKFYKVRNSHLVPQARSFQQMSNTFIRSKEIVDSDDGDENDNNGECSNQQVKHNKICKNQQMVERQQQDDSIDSEMGRDIERRQQQSNKKLVKINIKNNLLQKQQTNNKSCPIKLLQPQNNQQTKQNKNILNSTKLSLNHTIKLTIRPSFIKRYIQSTYNHPITQQKSIESNHNNDKFRKQYQNRQQSRFFKKIQKINKSNSHSQLTSKYQFESLDFKENNNMNDRVKNKRQQMLRLGLLGISNNDEKKKKNGYHRSSFSVDVLTKINQSPNNKQNIHHNLLSNKPSTPQLKPHSVVKLKTQTNHQFPQPIQKSNQNLAKSCILKKPIDLNNEMSKTQQKSNLKKSSVVGRNVSFLVVSMNGQRRKGVNVFQKDDQFKKE